VPDAWKEKMEPFCDKKVTFGIRPEDIGNESAERDPNMPKVKAKVEVIEPMGSETYVYLTCATTNFIARIDPHRKLSVGQDIEFALLMPNAHFFDGVTERAII
jgi:multiple sugar transport system ATP-binding protein